MSDNVRGALFNSLGDIEGLSVLDAFAGTGAIAIEAISRGAAWSQAVEKDPRIFKILTTNVALLGVQDQISTTRANVVSWSQRHQDARFDIVVCDPPYNKLQLGTVGDLVRHLKSTSIMVVSHPGKEPEPSIHGVVAVGNKRYGDAALTFYRLIKSGS